MCCELVDEVCSFVFFCGEIWVERSSFGSLNLEEKLRGVQAGDRPVARLGEGSALQ